MRKWWSRLSCGMLLAAMPHVALAEGFTGRFSLTLNGALVQQKDTDVAPSDPSAMGLELAGDGGAWQRVWGFAERFNKSEHRGDVTESNVAGDRVTLKLRMKIEDDPWVKGGRAVYDVDLRRAGDRLEGAFAGVFRGPFRSFQVKGKAVGTMAPPAPALPKGFVPAQPGERPRMLFRRGELPAIKAKLQTPVGKAAFEALKGAQHPVALGMMYQLTGDGSYAEQAVPLVNAKMAERGGGYMNLGHEWGERVKTVAYAYDLCYDAWDAATREKVETYLSWISERCMMRMNTLSRVANWNFGSNYSSMIRGGGATATLALWGRKGPAPDPPRDPGATPAEAPALAGFQPAEGVPVNNLESGKMPQRWLIVGPIPNDPDRGRDYLAPWGGSAAAHGRIRPGLELAVGDLKLAFQPLDPKTYYRDSLEFAAAYDRKWLHAGYVFTVVRNEKDRLAKFNLGAVAGNSQAVWLDGRPVRDQDYLRLGAGLHALLVRVHLFAIDPWGKTWIQPSFEEVTPEAMKADFALRREQYREALTDWELAKAEYDRSGGMDPQATFLFHVGQLHMTRYFRSVMGDDGFQGEGENYTLYSVVHPLEYAHCHYKMFGRTPTGRTDVANFAPRYVMTMILAPGRSFQQSFGYSGGQTLNAGHYARCFALVDEPWKPAVLWAWNRAIGLGASGAAMEGENMDPRLTGDVESAVLTLVSYPTDTKPRNPGEVMPRFWEGRTKGFFVFRNDWAGPDDFVAQVYARQAEPVGWNQNESGCFQIFGLGRHWGKKGQFVKVGSRWLDNVVMLPDDRTNLGGLGKVTYAQGDPKTGSGVVSISLDEVCRGVRTETAKDAKGKDVSREVLYDAGIRGMRSFAADYSGASGAPAMFVVVDRITGGKSKEWLFQMAGITKDAAESARLVQIEGNTFRIPQGDAVLSATFVSPAAPRIRIASDARKMSDVHRTGVPEKWVDVPLNAVTATGGDPTGGEFFVVITVGRGAAPPVKVEGAGLGARATVSRVTASFDGEKILLSK